MTENLSQQENSDLMRISWQADLNASTNLYEFFGLPNNDGNLMKEILNIRDKTALNYGLETEVYERYRERIERWKLIRKSLEHFEERLRTIIKAERRVIPLFPLWAEDLNWVTEKKPVKFFPLIKKTVKQPILSIEQLPCPLIILATKIIEDYSNSSVKLSCEIRSWWDREAIINIYEGSFVKKGYGRSLDPLCVIVAKIDFC